MIKSEVLYVRVSYLLLWQAKLVRIHQNRTNGTGCLGFLSLRWPASFLILRCMSLKNFLVLFSDNFAQIRSPQADHCVSFAKRVLAALTPACFTLAIGSIEWSAGDVVQDLSLSEIQ